MINVAINGFGRIGRNILRAYYARPELADHMQIVAINDLGDPAINAHLLEFDTAHGRFEHPVEAEAAAIRVAGDAIAVYSEREPENLPWAELGIDVVFECTGRFTDRAAAARHLAAGAQRVLVSAPTKGADATVVFGVNHDDLSPADRVVSNASCTTNCLAPVAKVLNDTFGIEAGLMTTVHAYTNDQQILDLPHSDLYRARAAAANIIPTSTGAAQAVGLVIPQLAGKLTGMAMRVPVCSGSVVDLTVNLAKSASRDEINNAVKAAAEGPMEGVLFYAVDPLVSSDIIDDPHSSIFASDFTETIGDDNKMAKVVSWYDNEWGYSCRTVDLVEKIGGFLG